VTGPAADENPRPPEKIGADGPSLTFSRQKINGKRNCSEITIFGGPTTRSLVQAETIPPCGRLRVR
jgi:hypothetical protein